MIIYRCSFANCPVKVKEQGYCQAHKAKPRERRGTAAQRGYDSKWQRYRLSYLKHNPICVMCEDEHDRITSASVVDHITPVENGQHDPLFWVQSNHQALCRDCHSYKTRVIDGKGWGVVSSQE